MKSPNKNADAVKANTLFEKVDFEKVKFNVSQRDFLEVKEGDIIFQNSDKTEYLYLIIEGEVKLKIHGVTNSPIVIKRQKNKFFGEKEIIDKARRNSSAVANTDSLLYVLNLKRLAKLLQQTSVISTNIENATNYEDEIEEPEHPAPGKSVFAMTTEKVDESKLDHKDTIEEGKPEVAEEPPPAEPEQPEIPPEETREEEQEQIAFRENYTEDSLKKELLDDPEDYLNWDFSQKTVSAEPEEKTEEPVEQKPEAEKPKPAEPQKEEPKRKEPEIVEPEKPVSTPKKPVEEKRVIKEIQKEEETLSQTTEEKELEMLWKEYPEALKKVMASENVPLIFDTAVAEINRILKIEAGVVYLLETSGGKKILKPSNKTPFPQTSFRIDEGIVGKAFQNNTGIIVNNPGINKLFEEKTDTPENFEVKNVLCVALTDETGDIVGVAEFFNKKEKEFTVNDEEFTKNLLENTYVFYKKQKESVSKLQNVRKDLLKTYTEFLIPDIRSTILTIKHFASFLKKKTYAEEVNKVAVGLIDQANAIIDLLDATKSFAVNKNNTHLQTVRFNSAMNDIMGLLAEYVESRNVNLYRKFESDGKVNLDKRNFYQACFQIAKNACDAMPDGGSIYVVVKTEEEKLSVEFKDTGKGIDRGILNRVFEPFVSKGKDDSVGLGLSISQKIIKEHNGIINAKNDEEEGAVFTIELPVIE